MVIFVFQLHILDYNLWEVNVCDIFVAFHVHLFWKARISCAYIENFAVKFDKLWDDVSEILPILIPIELSAVPALNSKLLCISLLPERLLAVVTVLLEVHI